MADTEDVPASSVDVEAGLNEVFGDDTDTSAEVDTSNDTDVEETSEEVTETEETKEEAEETTEESTDTKEESEADETESEQAQEPDQKEIARQAYLQRQAEKAQREAAQAKAQQEYLDNAADEQELALRQLQVDAYNNRVSTNSDRIATQWEKAQNIPFYQSQSPEVQEVLNDALDEFESRYVRFDNLGNPVEVKGNLYEFLSAKAEKFERLTQIGARNEKVAKAKQNAAITPPPASSPKEPKKDPLMQGMEAVFKD